MAVTTTTCYRCVNDFESTFDLNCLGIDFPIPGLKEVTWNFAEEAGPTTQNCDTDQGAPSGPEVVTVKPGARATSGFIRGDRCFSETLSTFFASGNRGILKTQIQNVSGVVDGSNFHQAEILLGSEATITNSKTENGVQEYNIPFNASNYIPPTAW